MAGDAQTSEAPEDGPRARVLGHPLDLVDLNEASNRLLRLSRAGRFSRAVTLNPELVVRARADEALARAIDTADLCVADGVGMVWAARRGGVRIPGRVPGVDLVEGTLRRGADALRVYFLGGRPGVAEAAAQVAVGRYGVRVAGVRDGYFAPEEAATVAEAVGASRANLVLAGLGERQETFLAAHEHALGACAAIGVGGTLDVLAGTAHRTPAWTRRAGLEWAWRVGLDPKRWHRAPRLVRFVRLVLGASAGRSR
ncbi:MAG: WecB/TagA/CpsF family glycosyltransferase [Trueperaceae bacterium]|nr:WecB/TagA/CpsF family glycosyltransferase [Trueperaceae bacterium]